MNEQGFVTVQLEGGLRGIFDPKTYNTIDHGYALTTHKSQGQTVDFTLVAAGKNMDAKGVYVAMTRHRYDVQLYYTREDFSSFKVLTQHLSRFDHKDLVKDYTILPENESSWQRVQDYRMCVLDGAAVLKDNQKDGLQHDTIDWQALGGIKRDQIDVGKEILRDFPRHKLYLEQAGLTKEMLQISTGQKVRPLSLMEERAKLTVEIYFETAQLTRSLWKEVRGKNMETFSEQHNEFQDLYLITMEMRCFGGQVYGDF